MSRAAVSKSRADKGGKPPASQTPVVSHEIVPGKFNDHDWNLMLDKDGSEDFVEDIVDDLIDNTLNKCFELYLERQLLPFTISQAKDAILSIIEWQFLAQDAGEDKPETDSGWIQDEEPDPAMTDCWAQGSVPRTFLPVATPEPVLEEEEEEPAVEELAVEQQQEEMPQEVVVEEPELEDRVSDDEEKAREEAEKMAREEEARQEKAKAAKKKKKFRKYTGRMKSPGINTTESLEQTEMTMLSREIEDSMPPPLQKPSGLITMPASCHSILKVQAGRPPGNKDVMYDDLGNVVAVIKINPERLPSHRVKVNYQVVDPAVEAAQARLQAMRTGRYTSPGALLRKKRLAAKKIEEQKEEAEAEMEPVVARKDPLPPPLIESMEVAPGVTVKEGGRVKHGPARYIRRVDMLGQGQKGMKPVSTQLGSPRLDVSDILDRQTPILRPMNDSPALPPIIPSPPTQPKLST